MIRIAGNMLVGAWLAAAAVAGAAELKGSITDADGLALPGANITVTGGGLGRAIGAVSGASGNYDVPGLGAGSYVVRVTHIGFRTSTSTDVRVDASGAILDITLDRVLLEQLLFATDDEREGLDVGAARN